MQFNRRFFLQGSGLFVAGGLVGCRDSQAPVIAEAQAPASLNTSQRRVIRTLAGMPTTDGAGVRLLRVIGQPSLRNLDPFLMLDRIYSDDPNAYIRGFPDHPHRGFETVSIMLDGKIRHRDSRGNQGVITGGGAQWMTAGRGIIHSEMPEQERGLLSGFQLWVNLPAAEKMCSQFYQDLEPGKLAHASLSSGGAARLISGNLDGLVGPVRARPTDPTLLTLQLEDERPFVLETPEGNTTFVFVHSGAALVGPENATQRVAAGTLAILGEGRRLRIQARDERAGLIVASGRPLHEPIAQRGPFVMNTEEELSKAWADYRAGVLDKGLVWCPGIPDRSGGCLGLLEGPAKLPIRVVSPAFYLPISPQCAAEICAVCGRHGVVYPLDLDGLANHFRACGAISQLAISVEPPATYVTIRENDAAFLGASRERHRVRHSIQRLSLQLELIIVEASHGPVPPLDRARFVSEQAASYLDFVVQTDLGDIFQAERADRLIGRVVTSDRAPAPEFSGPLDRTPGVVSCANR